MKTAARNLEFEKAALLRDRVIELRKQLATEKAMELGAVPSRVAGTEKAGEKYRQRRGSRATRAAKAIEILREDKGNPVR